MIHQRISFRSRDESRRHRKHRKHHRLIAPLERTHTETTTPFETIVIDTSRRCIGLYWIQPPGAFGYRGRTRYQQRVAPQWVTEAVPPPHLAQPWTVCPDHLRRSRSPTPARVSLQTEWRSPRSALSNTYEPRRMKPEARDPTPLQQQQVDQDKLTQLYGTCSPRPDHQLLPYFLYAYINSIQERQPPPLPVPTVQPQPDHQEKSKTMSECIIASFSAAVSYSCSAHIPFTSDPSYAPHRTPPGSSPTKQSPTVIESQYVHARTPLSLQTRQSSSNTRSILTGDSFLYTHTPTHIIMSILSLVRIPKFPILLILIPTKPGLTLIMSHSQTTQTLRAIQATTLGLVQVHAEKSHLVVDQSILQRYEWGQPVLGA